MAMSAEQFGQVLAAIQGLVASGTPLAAHGGGGGGGGRKLLDPRNFRMPAFTGEQQAWGDWSFAFKRTVRSGSREAYEGLDFVEKLTDEPNEEDMASDQVSVAEVAKISAELYDLLCQNCTGEAMSILRAVPD